MFERWCLLFELLDLTDLKCISAAYIVGFIKMINLIYECDKQHLLQDLKSCLKLELEFLLFISFNHYR